MIILRAFIILILISFIQVAQANFDFNANCENTADFERFKDRKNERIIRIDKDEKGSP